uniref:CSON013600 protein n=1 Tax=Culicoides sonorensis TaxID=179676 RepID=A0A336MCS0_CULSO
MLTARNFFIFNLASSDLLLCFITMPLTLFEILSQYWPFGSSNFVCKGSGYLQAISIFVSTISITAISIDRYQVILYPTTDGLQKYGAIKIIVAIWLISLILSLPIFLNRKIIYYELRPLLEVIFKIDKIYYCIEEWPFDYGRAYYSFFSLIWQYLLPLLIISIAYLQIFCSLKGRNKQQQMRNDRFRKTNILITLIAIIFGLSWLPINLFNLYSDLVLADSSLTDSHIIFYAFCHMVAMSSACFNPLLYGYFNDNFRKGFKEQLKCTLIRQICCTHFEEIENKENRNISHLKTQKTLTTNSTELI